MRCFEEAHTTTDPERRKDLLSFIVIGAGATGVELAGQIKELAGRYFEQSIRGITADDVTVTLVEGAGVAMPAYGGKLSEYTKGRWRSRVSRWCSARYLEAARQLLPRVR